MDRGLRDLKREATAEALAKAAFDLTRERGLSGFVTADVVERAGYSRRTFANHFSCKEEAVASVAFGGVEDASAILTGLPADLSLLDALLAVMRTQFTADALVRMRELMAMARQYPTLEPYVLGVQQRMRHTAQDLLASVAGDRYPTVYVPLLFGAVYGAVMAALEGTLDVHLGGESDLSSTSMDYSSFLDITFDYLDAAPLALKEHQAHVHFLVPARTNCVRQTVDVHCGLARRPRSGSRRGRYQWGERQLGDED